MTVKLKFHSDQWYNGVLVYTKGQIADVNTELGWANRWIVRGAEVVVQETPNKEVETPKEVEETKPAEPKKSRHYRGAKAPPISTPEEEL